MAHAAGAWVQLDHVGAVALMWGNDEKVLGRIEREAEALVQTNPGGAHMVLNDLRAPTRIALPRVERAIPQERAPLGFS